MSAGRTLRKRGAPLAMFALLLGGWGLLRAATWDSPLANPARAMAQTEYANVAGGSGGYGRAKRSQPMPAPQSLAYPPMPYPPMPYPGAYGVYPYPVYPGGTAYPYYRPYPPPGAYSADPALAFATPSAAYPGRTPPGIALPQFRLAPDLAARPYAHTGQAYGLDWHLAPIGAPAAFVDTGRLKKRGGKRYAASQEARPPFGAQPISNQPTSKDRWLLDAYAFYRQGSSAVSITQGRQPTYGASQLAANLQWRARPSSRHDPRVYARAYHALVTGGESEIATGVSALPLGSVPVRLYGELRATRNPASSENGISAETNFRPAAYAATEIPPQKFPLGFSLETYGAAGYVGGNASTYFVDGQAALTRSLTRIGKPGIGSAAVSVGAGVWGGAQKGAQRVDIGPTLRFDVNIGDHPARVSVDYREQVAGDAQPDSGVAATVSTRF